MRKIYLLQFFLFCIIVHAQNATEAKIYQNYPRGMQMFQTGYLLQTTNSTIDGNISLPKNTIDVNAHITYLRYAHFFNLGGKTTAVQVMLPYAIIDANFLGKDADQSGFGDLMIVLGGNILGGESLPFKEFITASRKTALAWSIAVNAPTGKYNEEHLLNPGNNRWQFKPELGLSVPLGQWDLETYFGVKFFTDNTNNVHLNPKASSSTLSQKPFYGLTFHVGYNFNSSLWASFDAASRYGGETSINQENQNNAQTVLGLGGTITYSPSIHHQIGVSYMTNAEQNNYAPQGALFNLKYSYVFGGQIRSTMKQLKQLQSIK